MNPMLFLILGVVIAALAVVGAMVSISAAKRNFESQKVDFDKEATRVRDEARRDAESKAKEIVLEAKDKAYQVIQNAEKETRRKQSEMDKLQHRLNTKEEALDKKALSVENKEQDLSNREKAVIEREKEITQALDLEKAKLQEIAELTVEEARAMLLTNLEKELKKEYATMIKEYGDRAKAESKRRSQQIVSMAIQRCAVDHVAESTVSVVQLSSDEMKGRIIGREGRNIRAFENLTGVDLVVDDTPEAVVISAFDPIRREIARQSLEKLVSDGRIHPARIEEIVEKTRAELEANIIEEGEKVTYEMKMTDLHPEIVKLLGRLKYRTSYGQNVLQHSIEVANLAASMASDLDVSVPLAKRGGLLHDIGKAVDFEVEGPHALIGGDLAKRYRESKGICHIINSHHADQEPLTIEAVLVQVADAVSGSRPGARREDLESYIKRLTRLEDLAVDFPGVDKAFAIQAGRELRIVVKPDSVDDDEAIILAREVAKKIETDLSYPGQIKVHVIRETRAVDYAK